jgi:hypothetical protein
MKNKFSPYNKKKSKTKNKFIMAINIFYYSPLQNNYHFALPRTIKCFGFRDILVFSQGPLVTKGLTGDIIVFSSFSSIVK